MKCRPCRDTLAAGRPAPRCTCDKPADLTCDHGVPHWVTGDTPTKRAEALAAWGGCTCAGTPGMRSS